MDLMTDVLKHPLFLLLAGAVLSGLLIPRLTQRWQDQRKALELKAALIERAARAVTSMFMAVQFAMVGAKSQTEADLDSAYRSWQQEKAVLTALLSAYFSNPRVDDAWRRCRALTTAYYVQAGIHRADGSGADVRQAYLARVAVGIALSPPEDWSEEATASSLSPGGTTLDLSDIFVLRHEVRRHLNEALRAIAEARLHV